MKRWYIMLFVFLAGFLMAGAAGLSEDQLEDLQDTLKIRAVNDDDFEDDFDVEYFQLKFATGQNVKYEGQDSYKFYVRVTVELTDKKTSTVCYVQMARERGDVDTEYTGVDEWEMTVPFGDLKKPKLTAYVIQYGVLVGTEFIVAVTETDKVDTLEELTTRTTKRHDQKPEMKHQHFFIDSDGVEQPSGWE